MVDILGEDAAIKYFQVNKPRAYSNFLTETPPCLLKQNRDKWSEIWAKVQSGLTITFPLAGMVREGCYCQWHSPADLCSFFGTKAKAMKGEPRSHQRHSPAIGMSWAQAGDQEMWGTKKNVSWHRALRSHFKQNTAGKIPGEFSTWSGDVSSCKHICAYAGG